MCVLFMIVNDTVFKSIFSAPRDYSSIDEDVTFSPGNVSIDVVITITDDNVFENELKEFTIELSINSTPVIVEPALSTILITDDDRMLHHIIINLKQVLFFIGLNNKVFCSVESDCSNIFISDSVDSCCVTEVAQSYKNNTQSRILCNLCYGENAITLQYNIPVLQYECKYQSDILGSMK